MQLYVNGIVHLQDTAAAPLSGRTFRLSVFNSPRAEFVATDATLAAVTARPYNTPAVDVAMQLQVLADPVQRYGDDKLLQFYVAESARRKVPTTPYAGVLYRSLDGGDVPVGFLNRGEVLSAARGAGVAVDIGAYGVLGDGVSAIISLSQAAYDALDPPDENTVYLIV